MCTDCEDHAWRRGAKRLVNIANAAHASVVDVEKRIYVGGSMEQFFEKESQGAWTAAKTRIYVGGPSGIVGVFNHDANLDRSHGQHRAVDAHRSPRQYRETILAMVDGAPEVAQRLSFDPWGNRRDPETWADYADPSVVSTEYTDRGFTGHEMLDDTGLVHMNGRIYDPLLGRFLSADPHVQFPGDSQSYNRYSYVHNNPLRYTDSSGYGIDTFFTKNWKTVVSVVLYAIPYAGPYLGTAFNLGVGAADGGVKGFFIAAGASYVTWGIGSSFGKVQNIFTAQGAVHELSRAMAHGISQSAFTSMAGGDSTGGFLAGSAGSFTGSITGNGKFQGYFSHRGVRMVAAAVVGGTMSELGGGKFANGAMSAAMIQALNHNIEHDEGGLSGGGDSRSKPKMKWVRGNGASEADMRAVEYAWSAAIAVRGPNGEIPDSVLGQELFQANPNNEILVHGEDQHAQINFKEYAINKMPIVSAGAIISINPNFHGRLSNMSSGAFFNTMSALSHESIHYLRAMSGVYMNDGWRAEEVETTYLENQFRAYANHSYKDALFQQRTAYGRKNWPVKTWP